MRFRSLLVLFLFSLMAICIAIGQSSLSQNSGINSADTWFTADLTISGSDTATLSSFIQISPTQTSNTLTVTPPTLTMHVEAGYDASGGLVMNAWPSAASENSFGVGTFGASFIRLAGGQLTVFDQNGNPVSLTMPISSMSTSWPLSLLGGNAGPSILGGLVVPNIQGRATALSASLSIQSQSGANIATILEPHPSGGTSTWNYVQSGSNWIAQSVTITPAITNLSAPHTIQFANVNWNDNPANDTVRYNSGTTLGAPPSQVTTTPGSLPTPQSDPSAAPTGTTFTTSDCNTHVYNWPGPQNVAFIHGLNSTSCAWTRMANWLNQDFLFATEVIPSLNANGGVVAEGQGLVNELTSAGGSNYILIGHSEGGLAARYAAQYFQNLQTTAGEASPVYGVVTVDTPHEGANVAPVLGPLLSVGLTWVGTDLWQNLGCTFTGNVNIGCYFAGLLYASAPVVAAAATSQWAPALADLSPGSTALNNLNSGVLINGASENFQQASITGETPQNWAIARWLDNFYWGTIGGCGGPTTYCCNPEDSCGERAVSADVGYFWDAMVFLYMIVEFEQWTWCDDTDPNEPCFPPPWLSNLENWLFHIVVDMEFANFGWNAFVDFPTVDLAGSGDGTSDALVQGPSQFYPSNTATQWTIYGSDSHSGAIKSSYDRTVLDQILSSTQFNVPTPAGCIFAVSNSPDSFNPSGGAGTFTVTTGAGCNWTAVSQTPWIAITSGGNGTSSGTVAFSVAPDSVTVPRQGTIQVGSTFSSAFFIVDEGGGTTSLPNGCSYSLSPGPVIATPPAGTSSTIYVSTSTDCPWSAVSNAGWLTITAGASGTGSGSFIFTAAPNTGNSDRTGLISVMNQALTVVDGIYAGTPGTATVTISGGPMSEISNPCEPTGSCPTTIYESGTVSVTVDGDTFTVNFDSAPPSEASVLASQLANLMNYPLSPVVATVSGTKITLNSAINGATANYPLVTSATFVNYCPTGTLKCFMAPAYTANASGTSLTGGTN